MARKNPPTISQEELYPPSDDFARPDVEDARLLDLDAEEESPFLRGQKRVSVRRGPLPKKTAVRLKWIALALTVACLAGMAFAALYRYGKHSWRFRIESSDDIEISGVANVARAQIMEVMGGDLGRNIFFVPLAQRKTQLEQIPWVESASVMRFVPNRLKVEIRERTPVAFARVGSRILLTDATGALMELPAGGKKKYSFPVLVGMNPGEPLSTRSARMKIYNELVRQLDSGGARYSQDLSEADLSDPDDVKVLVNDPQGEVLVHLGSSNFLDRYRIYVSHVREWRQQFDKLESVDLRYDRQIIVNPDLRGAVKQPALSAAAAKAAMAAGVKPAAQLVKQAAKRRGVKPARTKHRATKAATNAVVLAKQTETKANSAAAAKAAAAKPAPVAPTKPASDGAKASKKPSPAIAKGQEHP